MTNFALDVDCGLEGEAAGRLLHQHPRGCSLTHPIEGELLLLLQATPGFPSKAPWLRWLSYWLYTQTETSDGPKEKLEMFFAA